MEPAEVRHFLDQFRDFINLCESDDWPTNETTEQEIRNAFLLAQFFEKTMNRFKGLGVVKEFVIGALFDTPIHKRSTYSFSKPIKKYFTCPEKVILKKIINSNTDIKQVELGIDIFLEFHSQKRLQLMLEQFFVEVESKKTLTQNLTTEFSKSQLYDLKVRLLLCELNVSNNPKACLKELLSGTNPDCIELLVMCLSNKDEKYKDGRAFIKDALSEAMQSRKESGKDFWRYLFRIQRKNFRLFCLKHKDLFRLICMALFDVGKLFKENMSTTSFYIDLTYSEFSSIVEIIYSNEELKMRFLNIAKEISGDYEYWEGWEPLVNFD